MLRYLSYSSLLSQVLSSTIASLLLTDLFQVLLVLFVPYLLCPPMDFVSSLPSLFLGVGATVCALRIYTSRMLSESSLFTSSSSLRASLA